LQNAPTQHSLKAIATPFPFRREEQAAKATFFGEGIYI
jgi:hypothetical protein